MAVVGYKKVSSIAQVSVAFKLQAEIKERFEVELSVEVCKAVVKEAYDRSPAILVSSKEKLFEVALRVALEWDEQGKFDENPVKEEKIEEFEPSKSDLEDAYQFIDSFEFQGSVKQVSWARNIAHDNNIEIAIALHDNKTIPPSAKWWIDNRNNIEIK